MKKSLAILAMLSLVLATMPISPALAVSVLGQIASNGASLDGIQVPSGTTILDSSEIATGESPAVVHLSNGIVVALAANTSASFTGAPGGSMSLGVSTGEAALRDRAGEVFLMKADSTILLDQEGGVQEGEATPAGEEEESDGGGGWPWWAWVLVGGGAYGVYELVQDDDKPASQSGT